MKKMTKAAALVLTMVMMASALTACGDKADATTDAANTETAASDEAAETDTDRKSVV